MTVLPFPEYAPDISPFGWPESQTIINVYPRKDGYGPAPSQTAYSSALPAACRGQFYARNADGSVTVFAATSTRLWKLSNTTSTWVPVSKVVQLTSISNGTPAVFTLNSHGLSIGDAIVLSTSSALPTGLTVGTVYYVSATSFGANAFDVSDTLAHALAGTNNVATTGAGAGNHFFTAQYTAIPTTDQWQFAQFNNFVFAVQTNVAVQVYDLTTSTAFADLAGSPPQARYIAIVNRFVVLSGLGSSTPYRIQWSGLNATTTWTSGVNSSDFQDLPDGGPVRTIAGGEYGLILQDSAVRRMTFVGGVLVFQIDRVSQDRGVRAPLSICQAEEHVFYLGVDGFKMYVPGSYPVPIGKERVDRTALLDINTGAPQLCIGAADPKGTRVYFAYQSVTNIGAATFDKVLVYDYVLDKWASITGWSGEYISVVGTPGITLDGLDTVSSSIDALTTSLDDYSTVVLTQLSLFDSSHKLAFVTGPPLAATLDSSEQEQDGMMRMRVHGMRPITDATSCTAAVGARDTTQVVPSYSTAQTVNSHGFCPANVATRLARARVTIPAAVTWNFITGVEPLATQEGQW